MNEDALPLAPPLAQDFKDRLTGLKVFGVLEILCGALAAMMIPLMLLGQLMASRFTQDVMPLRQMINGVFVYGVIAVTLVWVGIGSFQARRWSRALSLIISWSWLITGVLTLGFMIWFLPSILKVPQQQGPAMPEVAQMIVKLVMLVVIGVMFVVVPTIFVCFYQSRHVKATCEVHDPVPRWTDSCPLPLLALCLWLGFGALTLLLMPVSSNGVLPVFGQLVSGPVGWVACLALAVLLGYAGWAMYRLQTAGWWITVATVCLGSVSGFITLSRIDLMEMYRLMGYGERQTEMMKQYTFIRGHAMAYLSLGGAVVMLAYLLFVRRYFRRGHGVVLPG
jgi:hypothetical protein